MGFIAQNTVADVVKMRNLNVIEENGVFDLGRIADDAVFAYERTAPYKGAMPYTAAPIMHGAVIEALGAISALLCAQTDALNSTYSSLSRV